MNICELEGVFIWVVVYFFFVNKDIIVGFVVEVLKDIIFFFKL